MKTFVVLGMITALLLGCAGVQTSSRPKSDQEKIDFAKGLALKDGKRNSSEIEVYRQRLDKLKKLCVESEDIFNLFTTDSHHQNIAVFLVTQNIFEQINKGKTKLN